MGTLNSPDQEDRFSRMVQEHRHAITRYGIRRLADQTAVEDLVAETFVVAFRHRANFPSPQEEIFWLYGIARRLLANQVRGQHRLLRLERRLAFERESQREEPRFTEDDLATLVYALGELDPDDRELLYLSYWERLDYRGLGIALGCSAKAAGVRLTRVRGKLREILRDSPEGVVAITQQSKENLL